MGWGMLAAGSLLLLVTAVLGGLQRRKTGTHPELRWFGLGVSALVSLLLLLGGIRLIGSSTDQQAAAATIPTATVTFSSTHFPPTATVSPLPPSPSALAPTASPTPVPALPLFVGVSYSRDVRSEPAPQMIHVIIIDLTAPGLSFLVTPGQPVIGSEMPARTTSEFLSEFGLQVAVNGDFFSPWHYTSPDDYYPHSGDPVDAFGLAASAGTLYSTGEEHPTETTLYLSADNRASLDQPVDPLYNAISGYPLLLEDGQMTEINRGQDVPHPRTAIGLSQDRSRLLLIVVDGRQTGAGMGVTLEELAHIALQYGAHDAINLDGGGSSALVIAAVDGSPRQLNSPIHALTPGTERPVANHLGVYAFPLDE